MSRKKVVLPHENQITLFETNENGHRFKLRSYQQEAVDAMMAALTENDQHPACIAATGAGKCLGKDTPVLLYDGRVVPVQDVQVGDLLMGPDSQPRKVLSLAQGREMLYRIIPIKGDSYVVNESHILSLKITGTGGKRVSGHLEHSIVNLSVKEYLRESRTFRHCAKGWRTGVTFPEQPISECLPPYALGVWLGDGYCRIPAITTADAEVADSWRNLAEASGMDVRVEIGRNCQNLHITSHKHKGHNSVLIALQSYGLIQNKHIPHAYLVNSRDRRLDILAGLLDTDGYYDGKSYQIVVKSSQLARDVLFLCRSLGFAAYARRVLKSNKSSGFTGEYHSISISGNLDEIPCRVKRRQAQARQQKKTVLLTGIRVEPIGDGDYYGFEIAGPDRLFLLGDFTVTHNTVIMGAFIERYLRENPDESVLVLAHRSELITQAAERFSHILPHDLVPAIHCASLKQRDFGKVTVASVQTVGKPDVLQNMPAPGLVIVDEAHRIPIDGDGQYQRLIKSLSARHRDMRVAGFTATPWRMDGGHIVGPNNPLNVTAYQIEPAMLMKDRFLVKPDWAKTLYPIETGKARSRKGDFLNEDLRSAAAIQHKERMQDILTRTADRQHTILFTIDRKHARMVANDLPNSVVIDGNTAPQVREERIKDFSDGKYRYLINVDLFIEGFDLPKIDAVVVVRPTQSAARWIQMVGRGLRTHDGKNDCLVLDYGGNLDRFPMKPDEPGFFSYDPKGQGRNIPGTLVKGPMNTETHVELPPPLTHDVTRIDASVFHSNHKDRDFLKVKYYVGMTPVEQTCVVPSKDFADLWERHGYGDVPKNPMEAKQRIQHGDFLLPRAVSMRYRNNPDKAFGYSEIVSAVHSWGETLKHRHTFFVSDGLPKDDAPFDFSAKNLVRPTPIYGQKIYAPIIKKQEVLESGQWVTAYPTVDSHPVHLDDPVILLSNHSGMLYVAEKTELDARLTAFLKPAEEKMPDVFQKIVSVTPQTESVTYSGSVNLLPAHVLGNLGYRCAQNQLWEQARSWWEKAAESGDVAARKNLKLLNDWMPPAPVVEKKSILDEGVMFAYGGRRP